MHKKVLNLHQMRTYQLSLPIKDQAQVLILIISNLLNS